MGVYKNIYLITNEQHCNILATRRASSLISSASVCWLQRTVLQSVCGILCHGQTTIWSSTEIINGNKNNKLSLVHWAAQHESRSQLYSNFHNYVLQRQQQQQPNNKAPAAWNASVIEWEGERESGSSGRAGVVAHVRQQQLTVWEREKERAWGREVRTWNCRQSQNATITLFSADLFQCILHMFYCVCEDVCMCVLSARNPKRSKGNSKVAAVTAIPFEHYERMWFMTCFSGTITVTTVEEMCNNVSGAGGCTSSFIPPLPLPHPIPLISRGMTKSV